MSKAADKRVQGVIARAEEQLNRREAQVQRQKGIIDRLVMANAVYADLAYAVENEAWVVEEMRQAATEARQKVDAILAVPNDGEDKSGE